MQTQIFTSALATADFMKSQKENGSAFVIGESGFECGYSQHWLYHDR